MLACRERENRIECYVRVAPELGLTNGAALLPSYLRYPGSLGSLPEWLADDRATIWSETIESDEGGRFYRDTSRYEIVRTDNGPEPSGNDGRWLWLSELKLMLSTSNVCAIQLRGLTSQLLGVTDL